MRHAPHTTLYGYILCHALCLTDATCPSGFEQVKDGVCMHFEANKMVDYCGAHLACHEVGKERGRRAFLVGKHAKFIQTYMPNSRVWTSVNTLLDRRYASRSGWRVGDPHQTAFLTADDTIPWRPDEPKSIPELIIESTAAGMNNVRQNDAPRNYACELANNDSDLRNIKRIRFEWEGVGGFMFADRSHMGCFGSIAMKTKIGCAIAWVLRLILPLIDCFAFEMWYFRHSFVVTNAKMTNGTKLIWSGFIEGGHFWWLALWLPRYLELKFEKHGLASVSLIELTTRSYQTRLRNTYVKMMDYDDTQKSCETCGWCYCMDRKHDRCALKISGAIDVRSSMFAKYFEHMWWNNSTTNADVRQGVLGDSGWDTKPPLLQ